MLNVNRPANPTPEDNVQLNSRQRAHLRSLAHPLKPVLLVGKEGVTDASIRSLEEALNTRELIKLKAIYEQLEAITDRCEDVANLIEGVVLENA